MNSNNFLKVNTRLALCIKHCEANKSQVTSQCALKKFVQRIRVEVFICSKKKDSSENSLNHTDAASR